MSKLFLYNTLRRCKEEFSPLSSALIGLYTCGPTVYNYAHLGNLRAFVFEDVLKRTLKYNGYQVRHIMNITDVGHLTGDMDMGEDKLEKGARREGKTAWDLADFYTKAFLSDMAALNLEAPDKMPKVTDHIPEQIELVKILEDKGYTYRTGDGVYFDTSKFPDYNKLSHKKLAELMEGARVEVNAEKKNPTDFALWKFSYSGGRDFDPARDKADEKRHMEWPSPWGLGFPGWHIECSALSRLFLKDNMDIHCGGIDHIDVHHSNEIAQSEAAYGEPFFRFWLHCAFLNIAGGKKMAKSADNFLTLENAFVKKGLDPLAYRFACLQTHYRKPMEYSEEGMRNAESGLMSLRRQVFAINKKSLPEADQPGAEKIKNLRPRRISQGLKNCNSKFKNKFLEAVNDDLNIPQALAVLQEVLKSDLGAGDKLATVMDFDRVLGLGLDKVEEGVEVPVEIKEILVRREAARADNNWAEADRLRQEIEAAGFRVEDGPEGARVLR